MKVYRWLGSWIIFSTIGGFSCGPPAPPVPAPSSGLVCVEPQTEPVLTAANPAYRTNIKRLASQGVVAVKFEVEGCNVYLKVLSNCIGKGSYEFTYEPGSDGWTAKDSQELLGRVPLGAAELSEKIQKNQVVRSQWEQIGMDTLPASTVYGRDLLEGSECAEATHVVSQIYLGGFTLASGDESTMGVSTKVFGVGAEGERVHGLQVERTSGTPEVCEQAKREKHKIRGCDTPLKLGLLPLADRKSSIPFATQPSTTTQQIPVKSTQVVPSQSSTTKDMVLLQGGSFVMGFDKGFEHEGPSHNATVSSFWMDITPVTVDAYKACVDAGKCTTTQLTERAACNWGKEDRGKHPINCTDWEQATNYCTWMGKRLPTEEEWEFAARGPESNLHPWGETAPDSQLCWRGEKSRGRSSTCEVGSFPAGDTPTGLKDMVGNVREWTSSLWCLYSKSGYDTSRCGVDRVNRGSAWSSSGYPWARGSLRSMDRPYYHFDFIGFRCAKSP